MTQFSHKLGNLHVNKVAVVRPSCLLKMHVDFLIVVLKIVSVTIHFKVDSLQYIFSGLLITSVCIIYQIQFTWTGLAQNIELRGQI